MKTRMFLLLVALALAIGAPACTTVQDATTDELEAIKEQFVGHY